MDRHIDEAVREQAYLLWEKEGRPQGRETEYWMRAKVAVAGKAQLDTLTKPAPKRAAKPDVEAPKVKAASSKARAAPSKTAKAEPAKTKPKKR